MTAMQTLANTAETPASASRNPSLSRQLIDLITAKPVSCDDLDAAALFTLDAVANILAGRNSPPGRKLSSWANGVTADGLHALHKENGGESSTRDLIRDVTFTVLHTDRVKFFSEITVAEIAAF